MNEKRESGEHFIADNRTFEDKELIAIDRRQDAMCMFLFGQTLNGDSAMKIEPTPQSWCGRMERGQQEMLKLGEALNRRFMWGAAFVVVAGAVIKLVMELWTAFHR